MFFLVIFFEVPTLAPEVERGEPAFSAALLFTLFGLLAVPLLPVFAAPLAFIFPVPTALALLSEPAPTLSPDFAPVVARGEPAFSAALLFTLFGLLAVPLLPLFTAPVAFLPGEAPMFDCAITAVVPRDKAKARRIILILCIVISFEIKIAAYTLHAVDFTCVRSV
jgi:hypothetical protein